jgi:hypothetical protein
MELAVITPSIDFDAAFPQFSQGPDGWYAYWREGPVEYQGKMYPVFNGAGPFPSRTEAEAYLPANGGA